MCLKCYCRIHNVADYIRFYGENDIVIDRTAPGWKYTAPDEYINDEEMVRNRVYYIRFTRKEIEKSHGVYM